MKTKIFKRITAAMLAATMAVTSVSASAENSTKEVLFETVCNALSTNTVREYIDTVVINYILAAKIDVSDGYSISGEIPIYNFNNMEIIGYKALILANNSIAGEISVYENKNELFSSFKVDVLEKVVNAYWNGSTICYGVYDDNYSLCINGIPTDNLFGEKSIDNSIDISSLCKNINIRDVVTYDEFFVLTQASENMRASSSISLPVEWKGNSYSSSYNGGKGICWAACIAMKVNFLKEKNLEATNVYDTLKLKGQLYDGSVECARAAYGNYSVAFNNSTTKTNQFIWNQLSNGNPVDICIRGYRYDRNGNHVTDASGNYVKDYHQVLIIGMTTSANGITYEIQCPNNSNVYISLTGSIEQLIIKNLSSINYVDNQTFEDGRYIVFDTVYRTYW